MNCQDIRGLITDAMVEELPVEDRRALEEHLAECAECRAYQEDLGRIWSGMAALELPEPRADLPVDFARRLDRTKRKDVLLRRGLAAAAAILLFIGGVATGRVTATPAPAAQQGGSNSQLAANFGNRYMLLVRDDGPGSTGLSEPELTREYGNWAMSLEGLLTASHFVGSGEWVNSADRDSSSLQGFFLIRATSMEEAVQIAEASPHSRYGGVLEVRQLAN